MPLIGTNQELGRPYNRRIVLEAVRRLGPISRADIARTVGLTAQTVSTLAGELESAGLVTMMRDNRVRRGQPAQLLTLNAPGAYALGVQLTPGLARAALVDLTGEIVARQEQELPDDSPETIFAAVATMRQTFPARASRQRLLGLGVAMPGPFGVEPMSFVGPTTLERLKGLAVRDRIAAGTGLPVFIDIDSATGAMGEHLRGAGQSLKNFYYLYLGAGLGGAFVSDRTVMGGTHGNAGEIGHLPIIPEGDLCPCGNRGCLERYVSLEALRTWLRLNGVKDKRPDIAKLARTRHPEVLSWIANVAPLLRRAIVMIENLFDPEAIVIGGLAPSELIALLIEACQPLLPSLGNYGGRTTERLLASVIGADAALQGAGVMALDRLLSPRGEDAQRRDCVLDLIELARTQPRRRTA